MKIEYDLDVDALYVYLREVEVARSVEPDDGVIVDLDESGDVVGVEFLHASERFEPADAELMLVDSGPDYTRSQSEKIRAILTNHTRITSLVECDVD